MNKAYTRINWENEPSTNTPINETNLNNMDSALDELDNRLIAQDTSKADKTEVSTLIANVEFDESTGIITVTRKNGSSFTIDTKLEKIAINFTYDKDTQQIILTLVDGTKQYIDLSALITQYEFLDSDTITFVVQADGSIKSEVLDGSITENKLQPNYLAQIKVETAKSETYMNNASSSAAQAKSYAVGGTGTREGEDNDNAKYYYQQAKSTDVGQLRQDVDEINRNLEQLEYSDVAGGKNLFDISMLPKWETYSTSSVLRHVYQLKPNTEYTLSSLQNRGDSAYCFIVPGSNIGFTAYTSDNGCLCGYPRTVTSDSNGYITVGVFYDAPENIIQLEEGEKTPFEIFIPSVKMLSEEVIAQNASLGEQGLVNLCNQEWLQGYYDSSSGNFISHSIVVCSKDKMPCNGGSLITLKYPDVVASLDLIFFNGSTKVGNTYQGSVSGYSFIAPSDATSFVVNIKKDNNNFSPSDAKHFIAYADNEIEKLKNDLEGKIGLFPSSGEQNITFDSLRLLKQGDIYVLQFYNGENRVGQVKS